MFRFQKSLKCFVSLHSSKRFCKNLSKVRVISTDDEDFMKISFRYGTHTHNLLSMKVLKYQQVQEVLYQIKLAVSLQRKREEIRRSVVSKYCVPNDVFSSDSTDGEELEVSLIPKSGLLEGETSSIDAWSRSSLLKIGDNLYEVHHNTPTVIQLTLPECILSCCFIRPHCLLECASIDDCYFEWFRDVSVEKDACETSLPTTRLIDDTVVWEKIGDGFLYVTTSDDVGHKLKVVCTPKMGNIAGPALSAVSKNVIESGPQYFPFQERHNYTKDLADSDCIRCVSYNILANCYVETKKFPYSSRKARDIYYRKQILIKELFGYNGDVVCLQEVQDRTFELDLEPAFRKIGMDGIFVCKGGRRYEGVAVFYRKAKFSLVEQHGIYLNEIIKDRDIFTDLLSKVSGNFKDMSKLLAQDTALQIVLLEHIDNPNHRVIVANTHLYSNKDKPEVRLIQSALCTNYVEHYLKLQKDQSQKAILFCGDFNSLPESDAHSFIMNGSFECSSSWNNNSSMSKVDTTLRHNLALKSACGTPVYTNYTAEFRGCLDYIFYSSNNLIVDEVVPMPKHEDVVRQVALPSEFFSSDHLALLCTLKWKQWQ